MRLHLHGTILARLVAPLTSLILLTACAAATPAPTAESPTQEATHIAEPTSETEVTMQAPDTMTTLIPMPASVQPSSGVFTLADTATIAVPADDDAVAAIGEYLAKKLRPATGYALQVSSSEASAGSIVLTLGGEADLGEEGYLLEVREDGITLTANQHAGLFRGVQTIRQLLPPAIESADQQSGPWVMPTGTIRDLPRYEWRGVMLDVARHFFSVEDVKRYIDLVAYYKINRFHMHLTDDQGWRIEIKSWPKLTEIGAQTAVNGDPGGFYTQEEYAEIVAYAQARYIIVVPEIDLPGHTNSALASYAELNCDDQAVQPRTDIEVGYSSLCIHKDITYEFVDDVIGELSAITPGPYIHIGGDEALVTPHEDYTFFIEKIVPIVEAHGKTLIGWEEIADLALEPSAIAQMWNTGAPQSKIQKAPNVILSPANRTYLDMKYDEDSELGLVWAGLVSVMRSYTWEPTDEVAGLDADKILGVEAPLWAETLLTIDNIEFMAFPRVAGIAEIGWSPQEGRQWSEYKERLGAHGPRLTAMGVDFFKSDEVPWR